MNYEEEALPPYHVLATSADRPYIEERFFKEMQHVVGDFGFPPPKPGFQQRSFPSGINWSKDGSVTDEIFLQYVQYHLMPLYPDAKDVPGFRVAMKADSGPGRLNEAFLVTARSYGFYFFPGLPNGTELGQEMDQVFALLKSIIEENRRILYKLLFRQFEGRELADGEDYEGFVIEDDSDDDDDDDDDEFLIDMTKD